MLLTKLCIDVLFSKSPPSGKEKKKSARVWNNAGNSKDAKVLDFSKANGSPDAAPPEQALATEQSVRF